MKNAIQLFKQKGYQNVTVAEITTACGIAKGTFFNYFQKKEHILLYLADSYMELLHKIVQRNQVGTMKEQVLHIFRELFSIYFKQIDILHPAFEETIKSAIRSNGASGNISKLREAICYVLEQGMEKKAFRSKWKVAECADVIVGIFLNVLICTPLEEEKLMKKLAQQLEMVWGGFIHESTKEIS